MKKMVALLSCLVLNGCGEKKGAEDSSAAAGVSPESQLVGFWLPNADKIIEALEESPPEGTSAEDLEELIAEIKEAWGTDSGILFQLAEEGVLKLHYDGGGETGSYSIVEEGKKGDPLKIDAELDSEKFSMSLQGGTLAINPPEGAGVNFVVFADRITDAEAQRRLAQGADAEGAPEPEEPANGDE
ncbi:MAG: hypothetical protein CMP28_06800 [Roseibacillus sp.]|nr:hypothetical protein [Roseibacillus sp.]